MRFIKANNRLIISTALIICLIQSKGYSQGTDIRSGRQRHFYIGFNISPAQTGIINNSADTTISGLNSAKKNSLFGAFEIGYQFSKYMSFSTGLGFNTYVSDLSLKTYSKNYNTQDSADNENYERRISGNNINEIQKVSYLNIPVLFNIQLPFNEKFGFYLMSGINFSIPLKMTHTSLGTFTYKGYYPQYDILIEKVKYEGFLSDQKADVEGILNVKSFNPELVTSVGFNFTVQNKIQISLGGFYNRMLSDISGYSLSGPFILSFRPNQMKSFMEGSTKVTASSIGLRVSFRYYLN